MYFDLFYFLILYQVPSQIFIKDASFVESVLITKYDSLLHCAAITLYLLELDLITRSASHPFSIHK